MEVTLGTNESWIEAVVFYDMVKSKDRLDPKEVGYYYYYNECKLTLPSVLKFRRIYFSMLSQKDL